MKILFDQHRQKHLRFVWQGEKIVRLQTNGGRNITMPQQEFEQLKVSNGVYKNESWSIAETTPLTLNLN